MTEHTTAPPDRYDDPIALGRELLALEHPTLLVFDCDGVLAPLVSHADDSVLLDGIHDSLETIVTADAAQCSLAILSGRSLDGLEQFGFPDGVIVVASYGAERLGADDVALTADESERLELIDDAMHDARTLAGDGAWIERKPASSVLHVFEADPSLSEEALTTLAERQRSIPGSAAHHGHQVLELMARPTDKGLAIDALRRSENPSSLVYFGDDIPDEDAFARLGDGDLGIKIGSGQTAAARRLRGPDDVQLMLASLASTRRDRP